MVKYISSHQISCCFFRCFLFNFKTFSTTNVDTILRNSWPTVKPICCLRWFSNLCFCRPFLLLMLLLLLLLLSFLDLVVFVVFDLIKKTRPPISLPSRKARY